jgi:hypothetical protein
MPITLGDVGSLTGIPGAGLAGQVIDWLGGLGGGGIPMGSTEFDGLHSPTLPALQASSMKAPEAGIRRAYALGLRISVEEVDAMMHADANRNRSGDMSYIENAWRATNLDNARMQMRAYNVENPLNQIHEGELGPRSAYGSSYVPTAPPVPSSANVQPPFSLSLTPLPSSQAFTSGIGGTIGPYIDAAITGAQDGITNVGLNTEAGKKATDQGAVEFLKNRWYIPLAIVSLIVGLAVALITKRK